MPHHSDVCQKGTLPRHLADVTQSATLLVTQDMFIRRAIHRRSAYVAALLASALTLGLAQAQPSSDWMDAAYDRATDLSSPWDLSLVPEPVRESADQHVPAREPTPATQSLVFELPWTPPVSRRAVMEIASIDTFDDPWGPEEAQQTNVSEDLVEPWAEDSEVEAAATPAVSAPVVAGTEVHPTPRVESPSPDPEGSELVEPWLD